jgi:hypothetical protein
MSSDKAMTASGSSCGFGQSRIRRLSRTPSGFVRGVSIGAVLVAASTGGAAAFPLIDPGNADQVPAGTELAAPDMQDLRHQLQLANGLLPPPGGGWTIVPRVNFQEMFTDNALQEHDPRQWDLISFLSPGVHIAGDMPRLQLNFDYAPALTMYARTSSLNSLTQQLNGIGLVTVVPDLLFIDVRALAGVQNIYGGIGGLGTIGGYGASAGTAQASVPSLAAASTGLNRDEMVQTNSFGVSPYLLRQFGDWGTGKLGYSANVTESDRLTGFAASPIISGSGTNNSTLVSNEEIAHFATGDFLHPVENSFDVDLMQSQTTEGAAYTAGTPGATGTNTSYRSERDIITDRVTWQINRAVAVFGSGGHENIAYDTTGGLRINDLTWSLGITLTPDPDTYLTASYGHSNGYDSLTVNGRYAMTGRTTATLSYGSTTGTQLENLQNQLNLATTNANGTIVNGQNGGQLYGVANALPLQNGVYRFDTLTMGLQTALDRDTFALNLLNSTQTSTGAGASTRGTVTTVNGSWLHELQADLMLSAALSYSVQNGASGLGGGGNTTSVAASIGLQYQISAMLSSSLRYSFFDRQAPDTAFSFYQNMLILGITKSF